MYLVSRNSLSNKVHLLTCHSVLPHLDKDTSTPFSCLTPKVVSTEEYHFFDDCLFSFKVTSVPNSIYPKAYMAILSPEFDYINLLQTNLLTIIFDTGASLYIYL